eukprot:m51a1_g14816 hypothetical protein (864) ;mRNA; f:616237-626200
MDSGSMMYTVMSSKYVPMTVVKNLVRNKLRPAVGVKEMRATALTGSNAQFLDVVNFTATMDLHGPNVVIEILEEMFDSMSTTLEDNGAIIDKYIGDSIMALWGCPEPVADSELKSCRAVWEMHCSLGTLNAKFQKVYGLEMSIRVGWHSGTVFAGNVGCSTRLNYTVLGSSASSQQHPQRDGYADHCTGPLVRAPLVEASAGHRCGPVWLDAANTSLELRVCDQSSSYCALQSGKWTWLEEGVCRGLRSAGAQCRIDRECDSWWLLEHACLDDTCAKPARIGEPCRSSEECIGGDRVVCSGGRCADPVYVAEGQPCNSTPHAKSQCGQGLFCSRSKGVCAKFVGDGEACDQSSFHDDECPGVCHEGLCHYPGSAPEGAGCSMAGDDVFRMSRNSFDNRDFLCAEGLLCDNIADRCMRPQPTLRPKRSCTSIQSRPNECGNGYECLCDDEAKSGMCVPMEAVHFKAEARLSKRLEACLRDKPYSQCQDLDIEFSKRTVGLSFVTGGVASCPATQGNAPHFYAQARQDKWLYENIYGGGAGQTPQCQGTFLEAGANNGVQLSNSLFFEEHLGWRGVCVEADPLNFAKLTRNRPRCRNNWAALDTTSGGVVKLKPQSLGTLGSGAVDGGQKQQGISIEVPTATLTEVLVAAGIKHVDVLFLDIEGLESRALKGLNLSAVAVDIFCIELDKPGDNTPATHRWMEDHDYVKIGWTNPGLDVCHGYDEAKSGMCVPMEVCQDLDIKFSRRTDKSLRLWDTASGSLLTTLTGHDGLVGCSSYDKTLRLWDAASGSLLMTLEGHTDRDLQQLGLSIVGDSIRIANKIKQLRKGYFSVVRSLIDGDTPITECHQVIHQHQGNMSTCQNPGVG